MRTFINLSNYLNQDRVTPRFEYFVIKLHNIIEIMKPSYNLDEYS